MGLFDIDKERPTFTSAVAALRPVFGEMLKIRNVRGVRLKDGRELLADEHHEFVMYDDGVQEEDDGGATLFAWSQIDEVLL